MYKTPCCDIEIPWNKARTSRALRPIKCPNCDKEFHSGAIRKWPWINILVFVVLIPAAVLLDIYSGTKTYKYTLPSLVFLLIIGIVIEEYLIVKKGVLVATTPEKKNRDKWLVYIFGFLVCLALGYEIYRAL